MTETPWYLKHEFWLALVTAVAIFLSSQFGIDLDPEQIVGIIIAVGAYFWNRTKERQQVLEFKMLEKEIELENVTLQIAKLSK